MLTPFLKRAAGRLPGSVQHELRRMFFHQQIRRKTFFTDEKEYALLGRYLAPGDWAVDIGANVGHYALRMAELVGATGRVIAIEPVPDTFALLAANARLFAYRNVSLLNVAASDTTSSVGMEVPMWSEGLPNYYQAHLVPQGGGVTVLTMPIDALSLPRVKLVKIDAEGHELPALCGMRNTLERHHPALILETRSSQAVDFLTALGYATTRLPDSSNLLCEAGSTCSQAHSQSGARV